MKKKRGKLGYMSIIAVVLTVVFVGGTVVRAVFDGDTEAKHINPAEIENSTLIIGTHLIHISVITDELYDVAKETAEISNQPDIYYKSELSGGTWYRISEAVGLSDISSLDKKVEDSVISSLYVRYHTKSDGVTYDLLENKEVCAFDTVNPYNLADLPELEALITQYDNIDNKKKKSDADKENMEAINKMLSKGEELKAKNAEKDAMLASLNQLYIKNADNAEIAAVLMSAMKQVDSSRRGNVYEEMEGMLTALLEDVQSADEGKSMDYDLADAIGTSLDKVMNKGTQCKADALEEGTTAAGAEKFNQIQKLAQVQTEAEAVEIAEKLVDLENIMSGISVHPDREASLIVEEILPTVDKMLAESTDEAGLRGAFAEGEFMAKAAISKMPEAKAEEFLASRTETLNTLTNGITDEALRALAESLKKDSVNELMQAMASLQAGNNNEMESLLNKKAELQMKMKQALDKNDLNGAKEYETAIADVDNQINDLNKKLTDILQSDTASEAEKAKAEAALGSGLESSKIEEIKARVKEDLQSGQFDGIQESLDEMGILTESSPVLAVNALKDIYQDIASKLYLLDEASQELTADTKLKLDGYLQNIEDMVAEAAPYLREEPEEEKIIRKIEDLLGTDFESSDEINQAAVIAALSRYAEETGSQNVKKIAAQLANDCYNNDNQYVFLKLQNEASEFIPLDRLAECCSYRYVFHDGNQTGILRRGTEYYEFSSFGNQVKMKEQKTEEMETYARYQSTIYLPVSYVEKTFKVSADYIADSEYAVLVTEEMEEKISAFLEEFLNSGLQ